MLGKLGIYSSIGLLVICGVLGTQNYFLNQKNDALVASIEIERIARKTAEERLIKSEQEYKNYYTKFTEVRSKNAELSLELKNTNTQLDDYKRREHVAIKKPALVERLAKRATDELFNEYACVTGNSRTCKDSKN